MVHASTFERYQNIQSSIENRQFIDGNTIMRYALFLGCTIPARLPQYEASARAVLETLGVELIDIREFNCCW